MVFFHAITEFSLFQGIFRGGVILDLFLVLLNILIILISIAGGVLLIGTLYRGYNLLGILIAEKKNKDNTEKKI